MCLAAFVEAVNGNYSLPKRANHIVVYILTFLCNGALLSSTANGQAGYVPLFPKYQVMGIVYAPPGAASSVTYGSSKMVGSSNSIVTALSLQQSFRYKAFRGNLHKVHMVQMTMLSRTRLGAATHDNQLGARQRVLRMHSNVVTDKDDWVRRTWSKGWHREQQPRPERKTNG